MKIRITGPNGEISLLPLVGTWEVRENPSGYGCLYSKSFGSRHYFAADGTYDGWEMEVSGVQVEGEEELGKFVTGFAQAIENDREIIPKDEQ
jgi:hypothetical protein